MLQGGPKNKTLRNTFFACTIVAKKERDAKKEDENWNEQKMASN